MRELVGDLYAEFIDRAVADAIRVMILYEVPPAHDIDHWARVAMFSVLIRREHIYMASMPDDSINFGSYHDIDEMIPKADAYANSMLAWEKKLPTWSVILAGAFHDVGRLDDSADPDHGRRGVHRVAMGIHNIYYDPVRSWPKGVLHYRDENADLVTFWNIYQAVAEHPDGGPGTTMQAKVLKDADKIDLDRAHRGKLDEDRLDLEASSKVYAMYGGLTQERWEFKNGLRNS